MATQNVIQQRDDHEGIANEAAALSDLVHWIVQARDVLDEIRAVAGYDNSPLLRELQRNNIMFRSADWFGVNAGEGLTYLLQHQNQLIKSLV